MKIHFETIGCRLNQIETQNLIALLKSGGVLDYFIDVARCDSAIIDDKIVVMGGNGGAIDKLNTIKNNFITVSGESIVIKNNFTDVIDKSTAVKNSVVTINDGNIGAINGVTDVMDNFATVNNNPIDVMGENNAISDNARDVVGKNITVGDNLIDIKIGSTAIDGTCDNAVGNLIDATGRSDVVKGGSVGKVLESVGKTCSHIDMAGECLTMAGDTDRVINNFAIAKGEGVIITSDPVTAGSPIDEGVVLCVLNTCAVTKKAETKCRHVIKLLLSHYPNAAIIVTGCYAAIAKNSIESLNARVKVLSMEKKRQLLSMNGANKLLPPDSKTSKSRAALKIQDGCNNNCSYCVIHIARGKSTCVSAATVIKSCQFLEDAGYCEVVFTGVNLAQYISTIDSGAVSGEDSYCDNTNNRNIYSKSTIQSDKHNFTIKGSSNNGEKGARGEVGLAGLLQLCLDATKKIHFRLSSIYGEVVTDKFCTVIKNDRVAPYFHISVQSGSDRILRLMNRGYCRRDVMECVKKLRLSKNNPFISCDIITGFPGESDSDFNDTLELCKECDFAFIHVFPYSARPNTIAAKMVQTPAGVSKERARVLERFAAFQKSRYISKCVGGEYFSTIEVSDVVSCVTENYLHCVIINDSEFPVNNGVAAVVKVVGSIDSSNIGVKKTGGASKVSDHDSRAVILRLL